MLNWNYILDLELSCGKWTVEQQKEIMQHLVELDKVRKIVENEDK